MRDRSVRKTLWLGGLALLLLGTSSHAEAPPTGAPSQIEMVRFRPLRIFSRIRGREERNEAAESEAESLQEPLAAPPALRQQSAQAPDASAADAEVDPLLQLVLKAIDKTSHRYLDAHQHRPWQIAHGLLALRKDLLLKDGQRTVNALEWISRGGKFRGEYWFETTTYGGRAHPYNGTPYEFEGHVNQTLALLSLSNLPLTHEFYVDGGRTVTMADMIRHAKMTVSTREEITWTLWFLTHYLDIDSEWDNAQGEPWSLEELVRLQTEGKVVGAPCGGTHGLYALAYARNAYLHKHRNLRGVWFEADQKIKRYIEVARSLQNFDGSFSTEYFKGPGHSRDFNERIKASGHMLEWLMMALPYDRLNEAWVRRAIASVATDLVHNSSRPAECGPLYHALHSLVLYRDRVSPTAPAVPENLAQQPASSASPLDRAEVRSPAPAEPSPLDANNLLSPLPSVVQQPPGGGAGGNAAGAPLVGEKMKNASPYVGSGLLTPGAEDPHLQPTPVAIEPRGERQVR